MKTESKNWFSSWGWLIFFIIVGLVTGYIISNSSENKQVVSNEQEASIALAEENQRHAKTILEDITTLSDLYAQWHTATNFSNPEMDINYTEINYIGYSYEYQYKFAIAHLKSAKEFIIANEDELKHIGIDTFEEKQNIDEWEIRFTEEVEGIKSILEITKKY